MMSMRSMRSMRIMRSMRTRIMSRSRCRRIKSRSRIMRSRGLYTLGSVTLLKGVWFGDARTLGMKIVFIHDV